MSDIVEFLLARIGEDEAVARAAAEVHGEAWSARIHPEPFEDTAMAARPERP